MTMHCCTYRRRRDDVAPTCAEDHRHLRAPLCLPPKRKGWTWLVRAERRSARGERHSHLALLMPPFHEGVLLSLLKVNDPSGIAQTRHRAGRGDLLFQKNLLSAIPAKPRDSPGEFRAFWRDPLALLRIGHPLVDPDDSAWLGLKSPPARARKSPPSRATGSPCLIPSICMQLNPGRLARVITFPSDALPPGGQPHLRQGASSTGPIQEERKASSCQSAPETIIPSDPSAENSLE